MIAWYSYYFVECDLSERFNLNANGSERSEMIHTAELVHFLSREHYDELEKYLKEHSASYQGDSHPLNPSKDNKEKGIIHYGWTIVSKYNGISYFSIEKVSTGAEYRRRAVAKIHLAQLATPGQKRKGDLFDDPSQVYLMASNFNRLLLEYTGDYDLGDISWWNVKRCDYAVDLHVDHDLVQPYIRLFQHGELPAKNLSLRRWNTEEGNENTTIHDENGSLKYNIYGKYWRELNKGNNAEPWRNTLRFEMQLFVDGIKEVSPVRKIKTLAYDQDVLAAVKKKILKSFRAYAGDGDYYRVDALSENRKLVRATTLLPSKRGTDQNVEENEKRREMMEAVVNALASVADHRGLWDMGAKEKKAIKKALKGYGINLVPIPAGWDITSLPSLGEQFKKQLKVFDRGGKLAEPETEDEDEDEDEETMETPWD